MTRKKKITQKSSRISIGECSAAMGKTWEKESFKDRKNRGSKRERWLLTRKTWRYMADAGRKLIPDGVGNRPEDVPKIEAYFQEVCQKEPRFLLWRKQSYPGALGFRSRCRPRGNRIKLGSVRENTSSADEAENIVKVPSVSFLAHPRPAGRYELEQLRKEFLFGSSENNTLLSNYQCPDSKSDLVQFINDCIGNSEEISANEESSLDHEQLLEKLEDYISKTKDIRSLENKKSLRTNILESDNTQINLLDTLRRYYARSTNREKVIGDILMDRKLLENLYFELRKTRGFLGRRVIGSSSNLGLTTMNSLSSTWKDTQRNFDRINSSSDYLNIFNDKKKIVFSPNDKNYNLPSPPPVIEIEDMETKYFDFGIQTLPLEPVILGLIEDENRRKIDSSETFDNLSKASSKCLQRKTSMENDDISPSVSDTIKRYLRMARKKSVETDKVDRFKRVNYDRNIRNIKGKGEPDICEGDDTNKSTQTDDSWLSVLKTIDDNSNSRITSSRSSIDTGTTFSGEELLSPPLSPPKSLNAPGMQKSRSSTNVQQGFMSKRIWKGRSKSQTRTNTVASLWTPLGNCLWLHASGKSVLLKELCLLDLTELEKEILSFVSLNKLQEISLGVPIRIPTGNVLSASPKKRRPYILKRRANTTGNLKDKDDNESLYPRTIFGVSLNDCLEQERSSRSHLKVPTDAQYVSKSTRGRSSFSSYIEVPKDSSERSHSCDSTSTPPVSELIKNFTSSSSDILSDDNDDDIKSKKNGVPSFVTSCLTYLEKYGLHKVGVFRISSSKKRLRQLREDFDHGKTLEETLTQSEDHVHDVATLLKEYFRALPDALLCNDLYQCFIQTQKIRNRHLQLDAIKHLIQLLPIANRNTLYALLKFLNIMAKYSEDSKNSYGHTIEGNKMDASNLATLFAPNILHKSLKEITTNDLSEEMTMERRLAIDVVTALIVNCDYLFKVPAELLDEVYVHMLDTNPEGLDNVMKLRFSSVEKTIQNGSNQDSKETLLNVQDISGINNVEVESSKPSETQEKKIWTRGEFTHQNSGIGGSDDNEEYRYKPRERETRRSRSKGVAAFFPDDVETFTYPVFERMQMNRKSEKSSNNQTHANGNQVNEYDGVITASLMIPVPMKQSSNLSHPLNVEDTDIPFIEDESRHTNSSATNCHRMLATVSSDSSTVSSPPTSPDNISGTTNYSQDYYHKKNTKSDHRSTQSNKDLSKDVDPDHYKADKKGKEKDIKFYQKILSSTGLDRLSKSASSTGVPKNSIYKDKLKHGHEDATLSPEPVKVCSSISNIGGAVLRSKTADIEHILRKQSASKPRKVSQSSESSGSQEKPKRKTSAEATRHPLRMDPDPNVGERLAGSSSYRSPSPTRNVWRRKDVISSMPKYKKPYN
ncbi:uncharacterized protein LOC112682133 isoform X2 [Sipha flava]|nr:uncharacterized protein LOC112682133 isoform X2 [Sipha flava]